MEKPNPPRRRGLSRRRLLFAAAATALVSATGVGAYTRYVEPFWFEVVERPLPIAGLPSHLVGTRLVQLSDLHVGRTDWDYLAEALRYASSLDPDFLVVTGDFVSHRTPAGARHLGYMLRNLKPARRASFACLGNHDYGRGWMDETVADAVTKVVNESGIRMLRDEVADHAGLQFAGIDDLWSPRFDARAATKQIDPDRAALALCHNPDACDLPVWNNFRGWILSGHTHGGQCKPPFLPPPLLPVRNKLYVAGEYDLCDGRRLYINRAIGYIRQMRINVRPEITLFTLRAA